MPIARTTLFHTLAAVWSFDLLMLNAEPSITYRTP
jgi:hypothetical protein